MTARELGHQLTPTCTFGQTKTSLRTGSTTTMGHSKKCLEVGDAIDARDKDAAEIAAFRDRFTTLISEDVNVAAGLAEGTLENWAGNKWAITVSIGPDVQQGTKAVVE